MLKKNKFFNADLDIYDKKIEKDEKKELISFEKKDIKLHNNSIDFFDDEKKSQYNDKYEKPSTTSISFYLKSIKKFKVLTKQEELNLAKRVKLGDRAAKCEMIERNLRLVVRIAKKYSSSNLELLDLIEEGNLGLIRAIEKFDISKGCRLSTYAVLWIKQSIEKAVMTNPKSLVKLPIHVVKEIYKYKKDVSKLTKFIGRKPSRGEVIESLKIDDSNLSKLDKLCDDNAMVSSLDIETNECNETTTFVEDDPVLNTKAKMLKKNVDCVFKLLNNRQKDILIRRYGLFGKPTETLDQVGKVVKLTRERVRQVQTEALSIIKEALQNKNIDFDSLDILSV